MPDPVAQYVLIYYYNLRIAYTAIAWMWDAQAIKDPNVFTLPMPDWYLISEQDNYAYDEASNAVYDTRPGMPGSMPPAPDPAPAH